MSISSSYKSSRNHNITIGDWAKIYLQSSPDLSKAHPGIWLPPSSGEKRSSTTGWDSASN